MKTIDYIRSKGGTGTIDCPVLGEIAAASGCSHRTLYMIVLGHKQPGPKLAVAIETATNAEVTRNELRPDLFGPAARSVEGPPLARRSEASPKQGDEAEAAPALPVDKAA